MDDKTLTRVARLAGIRLDPKEIPGLLKDMTEILAFVTELEDPIDGLDASLDRNTRGPRSDDPERPLDRDAVMRNTVHREAGCYRVPRMGP